MNGFLNILAEYDRLVGEGLAADRPALRAASAGEVFGTLSQRGTEAGATVWPAAEGFSAATPFHAAVVVLLLLYVLVLYRHPELPAALREYIFSPVAARDGRMNDNRHDPLRGFSWGYLLLGAIFFCTAVIRLTDLIAPDGAAAVSEPVRLLAVPAVVLLFFALIAFQNILLYLAGSVTVSRPFTMSLVRVKTIYFRLAAVVITPILLMWALSPAGSSRVFEIIIALQVLMIAVAFLRETFLLFVSKKLSIYHWILYLCAVEAFPVSLVCLLAARG